jgi:hypothetical protein
MTSPRRSSYSCPFIVNVPVPSKTCHTDDADVLLRRVAAPDRTRCISVRIVVSASPPVVGLVNRIAAWPGDTTPRCPSSSSSSCAVSAASVCSHR